MRVPLVALLLLAPAAVAHAGEDDCGSGGDAPFNVFAGAILDAPIDCVAHLGGAEDERDSYRFEAPPGMRLRVEVTPLTAGHFPNLGLFSPDHDGNGGSRLMDRNDRSRMHLEANSTEPGLWGFYVYLMASNTSGTIAHGDYRLTITLEGEAWTPDPFEGSFLLGSPVGSQVGRAIGPAGPEQAQAIDGAWIELAQPTTLGDFLAVTSDDCDECLLVSYRVASGSVLDASCQRREGSTYCLPFAGVTHVLVHASEGTEISFSGLHYHP